MKKKEFAIDWTGATGQLVELVGEPWEATTESVGFLGTGAGSFRAWFQQVRRVADGCEIVAAVSQLQFAGPAKIEVWLANDRGIPAATVAGIRAAIAAGEVVTE